jgi:signal transduction histidine kinase/integral membrane sensor domain MASE1
MVDSRRNVALALELTFLYVVTGKLGLTMDAVSRFATLVWAPTGIALALVLLLGNRWWPAIWLGAFFVNWWTGAHALVAGAIGVGNVLEAVVAAGLLRRIPGFSPQLDRARDVIGLLVIAALFSTMLSATIGTLALRFGGQLTAKFGETWRTWWLGDMIGSLIVAPALLTVPDIFRADSRVSKSRLAEAAALASLLGVGAFYIFFGGGLIRIDSVWKRPVMLVPLLIWAALRFSVGGAARAVLLVGTLAIWGTAVSHHPFHAGALRPHLLELQVYLAAMAGTFLILGAVVEERRHAFAEATRARDKLGILADASCVLSSTLEFRAVVDRLAHLVVARLGNACGCVIDLFAKDGTLHRYASAAADSRKQHLLEEEGHFPPQPGSRSPILRASEAGGTMLISHVDESVLDELAQGPEHHRLLDALDLHSLMIVPMVAREHVLGVLTVPSMRPDREYSEADLAFLANLAGRSAVQIDNARLLEAASDAIRAREDTLAMVAHDLRSPLGTIKLSAELLRGTSAGERERVAKAATLISTATERMNELVDDLLETGFLEAGALALDCRPVVAQEIVSDCVMANASLAAHREIRIREETWPGVTVLADRSRVLQALDNLVGNAIKFTPAGGVITLRAEPKDRTVVFSVSDTGLGIPSEAMSHLFERYWTGTPDKGHGLGLFIAQAIVTAHGSRIEVDSHVGTGTTFRFSLRMPDARQGRTTRTTLAPA